MRTRRTGRRFVLAGALVGAVLSTPSVAQQGGGGSSGLKPADRVRPAAPPEIDTPRPEPTTPPDGAGGSATPAIPRADAEERLLPDAGRMAWRMWLARNFHEFEAPPLAPSESTLPPHLVDPVLRAEKRTLYVPEVRALLGLLVKDPDDRVRGAAAISLARTGLEDDPTDVDAIVSLLSDDQRRVRDQALLAASLADGSATRYHLLRYAAGQEEPAPLTESEKSRLRAVASTFASLRGESSLPQLVQDLARDRRLSTALRALVVQSIGLAGNAEAAATLVALANERAEPTIIRSAAISALGALGARSAAPTLVSLVEDRHHDAEVRAAAALAVGLVVNAADTELVKTLVRAHDREGNAMVARFLLLSLGRIGGTQAENEIDRVLLHGSAEERVFAELALGLAARAEASAQKLSPLLELLRSVRVQDERCALLCALGLSGLPQLFEPIAEETLKAPAPEVRRSGIVALAILGGRECVPLFQKLLLDDDAPEVRIQAARALARLDPGAASTLIHAIGGTRSRGTSERAALILSLGFTRDPSTLDPLLDLLREPGHPSQEREAATLALGLVYDSHRAPPVARLGESKSFLRESPEIAGLLTLTE